MPSDVTPNAEGGAGRCPPSEHAWADCLANPMPPTADYAGRPWGLVHDHHEHLDHPQGSDGHHEHLPDGRILWHEHGEEWDRFLPPNNGTEA